MATPTHLLLQLVLSITLLLTFENAHLVREVRANNAKDAVKSWEIVRGSPWELAAQQGTGPTLWRSFDGILVAQHAQAGMFTSRDGEVWDPVVKEGLPPGVKIYDVAICGGRMYLATEAGVWSSRFEERGVPAFFKHTQGDLHGSLVQTIGCLDQVKANGEQSGGKTQGKVTLIVGLGETKAENQSRVAVSTDGGMTWVAGATPEPLVETPKQLIATEATSMLITVNGSLYTSNDLTTWTRFKSSAFFEQVGRSGPLLHAYSSRHRILYSLSREGRWHRSAMPDIVYELVRTPLSNVPFYAATPDRGVVFTPLDGAYEWGVLSPSSHPKDAKGRILYAYRIALAESPELGLVLLASMRDDAANQYRIARYRVSKTVGSFASA